MNKNQNDLINKSIELLNKEFGEPTRTTLKVNAWNVRIDIGVVLQIDQPTVGNGAHIWIPYPPDGQPIPEMALQYPGDAGRHSNTYPSPGLKKGLPALKLIIKSESELIDSISYIKALRNSTALPEINADRSITETSKCVDTSVMPSTSELPKRREAITRSIQREVWQRDGGKCVECGTREKLCFDHIIPFSRGGSNTIRNLQLLCERCNLSKGNRI